MLFSLHTHYCPYLTIVYTVQLPLLRGIIKLLSMGEGKWFCASRTLIVNNYLAKLVCKQHTYTIKKSQKMIWRLCRYLIASISKECAFLNKNIKFSSLFSRTTARLACSLKTDIKL